MLSLSLAGFVAAAGTVWLDAAQGPPLPPREARPQQGQPPRDLNAPGAPIAAGKGSISGVVVVAGSGQPARRARVNLSGGPDTGGGRSTTSDDQGRFAFTALPEGRFDLSASKAGHLAGTYGQRQPGRPGTPIQLGDGQRLQVQLQITRGSVITGTVLDEHGEALPGTPVRTLRYVMQSGQRTLQSAGGGQTDDRGVYRIYGLQPGDYLVFATPRNNNQGLDGRQAELQQLLQQSAAMERLAAVQAVQAQALTERIAQLRSTLPATSIDEATSGYAPVYYPGTTTPSSAAMVTVGAGEEKGNIDFQYQVVPIARVEGIVTSTTTQLPPNVQISLFNSSAVPGALPGGTRADAQGAFQIPNVPPGRSTIIARATLGGPGRQGGPAGRGPDPCRPRRAPRRTWSRRYTGIRSDSPVGDGRRHSRWSQCLECRPHAAAWDGRLGSSRLRGHAAAAHRPDASARHAHASRRAGYARRGPNPRCRTCGCGWAFHRSERGAWPISLDRIGVHHRMVSGIDQHRRSGVARLSDRGEAESGDQRGRRHVCRSTVRAHRHDRQ